MGLGPRELVALSGGHTLGRANGRPFTSDPTVFSNSYFGALLEEAPDNLLDSDRALLNDPDLRALVETYAQDETRFFEDFADASCWLSWLGGERPAAVA